MKDIISEYFKTTLPKRINNYYIKLTMNTVTFNTDLGEHLYVQIMGYNPVTKDKVGFSTNQYPSMMFYYNLKHSDEKEIHTEIEVYKNHIISVLQEMIVKLCVEIVSKQILPMEGDIFTWEI